MKTEGLTRFFIRQPMLFWSAVVAIIIGGILSFMQMPKLEDPAVAVKQASVVLVYPGASAHEVELKAVQVVEDQLRTLPNVEEIRTECREGMAMVTVEFKMTVLNEQLEEHFDLLRRKMNDVRMRLPSECYDPIVIDDMMDVYGIFYALVCDEGYSYPEMEKYAKYIRRELLTVDGVKRINVVGSRSEVVNIKLSKDKLSRNGIIPTQVMMELQNAGKTVNSGKYEILGSQSYQTDIDRISLRVNNALENEKDIADLMIKTAEGKTMRLGDIAEVSREYSEPQTNGFYVNGHPAIAICIAMQNNVIVPDVGKAVDAKLEQVKSRIPAGMTTEKIFFQPDKVSQAINGFMVNLLESVLIVILVLMFTMGFRSGLIIGFGLVLTIAVSFPILLSMNSTLQRISLGAFIVAMGMLVDNAIVIMDGILIDKQRGMGPKTYLYRIGNNTAIPLLGATIIAISTFIAVYMSPDSAGEYCRDLFLVLCVSLFSSWVLALIQVPVCAKEWLPVKGKKKPGEQHNSKMHRMVRSVVTTLIGYKTVTICFAVVLLVVCGYGMTKVKNLFFPDFDYSQFVIECQLPNQTSPDRVRHDLLEISAMLQKNPKVDRVAAVMGNAPAHYCLVRPMTNGGESYGELMVDCKDFETVNEVVNEIRTPLRQRYPDAYIRFRYYNFSIASSHPVEVQFRGPDPAELRQLSKQAEEVMRKAPHVDSYSVQNNWKSRSKILVADYIRQNALRAGVNRSNIADALLAATDGLPVGVIYEGDKQLVVNMQVRNEDGTKIKDLKDIPVWSMMNVNIDTEALQGMMTGASSKEDMQDGMFKSGPLSNVTSDIALDWEEPFIYRVNGQRCIEAECDPNTTMFHGTVAKVTEEIKANIDSIPLPEGYTRHWAGESKMSNKATTTLMNYMPITLMIILTILLLLFRNWKEVGLVLLCIPFVICGITPALLIFRQPFTFMAIVGLMGLMGMMVKNAIVLVDEINRLYKVEKKSAYDAVVTATVSRVRPVIMASATTILGMAPLLGDPMYGSMAICIMSGLAVGTLITLVLLPVLYSSIFHVKKMKKTTIVSVFLLLFVPAALNAQQTSNDKSLALSVKKCREMALQSSEDMKKSSNEIEKSELDIAIARMSDHPTVDGSLTGIYMKDMDVMGNDLLMRGTYMAGITIQQPIYTGGQITAGKKLAALGKECAEENLRKTKAAITADADKAYYTFLAVDDKVKMLEAFIRQLKGVYDKVNVSVKAEMATPNDLLRVQTKQSEMNYQLQKALNGRELCRIYLCNIIGMPFDTDIVLTDTVMAITAPEGLDENITLRPEVSLLKKNMEVKEQQIKMAKAALLPSVGLQLGYTYYGNVKMKGTTTLADGTPYSFTQSFHDGMPMAMLGVQIPIFHWGTEQKKVKKAQIDLRNAQMDYDKNTRLMTIEVRQSIQNLTDSYRMVQTAELGCRQADENLRVMRNKFDYNMATMTDLLEAQAQWQQAQSNLIEAKTQYKIYQTDYLKAVGRL